MSTLARSFAALVLGWAPALAADSAPTSAALTRFSWDRVPVYIHFTKRSADLTDAEADFVARNFQVVTLEKTHGAAVHGSTEEGIYATARQLKARNPRIKVLFYFNAFVNWQPYDAFKAYRPEWTLRNAKGEIVTHPSGTPRPDPSDPALRAWWSETVAEAMRRAPLDGVFADALPQALAPGLRSAVGAEKANAVIAGMRDMIALTKRKIGQDRIVLVNGTRALDFRGLLDWEGIDGVMIEHFAAFKTEQAEDIQADLDTFRLAEAKGKFVVLKGWPGFNWQDKEMMARPHAELVQLARERIEFPLACFLVAARPGSYFCYSWGYTSADGMLEAYPEFRHPLGPPKADAVWQGRQATREFAHAKVFVDLAGKTARIEWQR